MAKVYTIGRDPQCDIVIADSTDVVSRTHATIRVEKGDKIFLIDQSRNGTYVNGMKMSSNEEIPVSREDVISFAHVKDLDWSLVPKAKSNAWKIVLIILGSIFTLIAIGIGIFFYMVRRAVTPDVETPSPEIELVAPAKTDTVVVRDTVYQKNKPDIVKGPEVEAEKAPEVEQPKQSEPEEETVVNPIY